VSTLTISRVSEFLFVQEDMSHANINLGLYLLDMEREARGISQKGHAKKCVGVMDAVPFVT
jgi:hypothetical protein